MNPVRKLAGIEEPKNLAEFEKYDKRGE